ncbi:MAG: O-antigen ligase family protein [Blastocatellia bacterium]|nr:O-antigen ligase family protein [Blastocatellia bacterium]
MTSRPVHGYSSPMPPIAPPREAGGEGDLSHPADPSAPFERMARFDACGALSLEAGIARWANRLLLFFLFVLALSVPHSIAVAQASGALSLLAWIARDGARRRLHVRATPIDLPLLCFSVCTILSSVFSAEPSLSLPKLKGLLLFGIVYVAASNLSVRGVRLVAGVLLASSLVGVGFSLAEKVWGRGMIVTSISEESPLRASRMQPGDVIWMIARSRVASPEQAAEVIRRHAAGETLSVETLHDGDPVEVAIQVTEEMKTRANPLGIAADGRSRRFRVSGFSRQFQTYAEQMQMLGLLVFGGLLVALRRRRDLLWRGPVLYGGLFLLFSFALMLTATRAVIAAFIGALVLVSIRFGGRIAPAIALAAALGLGGLGLWVVKNARNQSTVNFQDDSTSRRLAYMQAGLRLIPQHPLLGVGMDSHKRHWTEWGFPGDYITHTHSTPVQIAMERGLPALFCLVWLIVALLRAAWRRSLRAREAQAPFAEGLHLGLFGALLGFSISSLTNYNFGDSEVLMQLLLLVGMSLGALGAPRAGSAPEQVA